MKKRPKQTTQLTQQFTKHTTNTDTRMAGEQDKKNELDEFDPGAAQFGNFINYYEFNPPKNRLALFEGKFADFFCPDKPVICLDVGCNTGELTRGLCAMVRSSGRPVHMMAVDLDGQLIERAREMTPADEAHMLTFEALNVVTQPHERDQMWTRYLERHDRKRFDAAFCFSTTMWIHLNHGDDGLRSLLTCLANWADSVVVEPQPWKCYRNAARRLRRAKKPQFPAYESLEYRSDVLERIDDILRRELGLHLRAHLGQSEWNRPVLWYSHPTRPT